LQGARRDGGAAGREMRPHYRTWCWVVGLDGGQMAREDVCVGRVLAVSAKRFVHDWGSPADSVCRGTQCPTTSEQRTAVLCPGHSEKCRYGGIVFSGQAQQAREA